MKIQGKSILVLPDENPDETKGGIIIPKTVVERPPRGIVKAIGPGCETVNVGNAIHYFRKGANLVTFEGVDYHFIIEDHVFYIE